MSETDFKVAWLMLKEWFKDVFGQHGVEFYTED